MQKPFHFTLTIIFPGDVAAIDEPGALTLVLRLALAQSIEPFEQVFFSVHARDANIFVARAVFIHRALRRLVLASKSGWFSICTISLVPHSNSAPLMNAIHLASLSSYRL